MAVQSITILSYAISVVIYFTAGWTVNGWRHNLKLQDVQIEHAKMLEASAMHSLNAYRHMELVKDEAIKSAEERVSKNAANAKLALDSVDRCAATLPKSPLEYPPLPAPPSIDMPPLQQSYSERALQNISEWLKLLTSIPLTSD